MKVLILGGTAEARALADALHAQARDADQVVFSLAGRTSRPSLPDTQVRIGGFGGTDGLAQYLRAEKFDAVVDATHPFAQVMSANAALAAAAVGVRLIALRRPGWLAGPEDQWVHVADVPEAARHTAELPGDAQVLEFHQIGGSGLHQRTSPGASVISRAGLPGAIIG